MKFLPGRMHWNARGAFKGSLESLLPLRIEILPGRTALKMLDPMALCTDSYLPPPFEELVEL